MNFAGEAWMALPAAGLTELAGGDSGVDPVYSILDERCDVACCWSRAMAARSSVGMEYILKHNLVSKSKGTAERGTFACARSMLCRSGVAAYDGPLTAFTGSNGGLRRSRVDAAAGKAYDSSQRMWLHAPATYAARQRLAKGLQRWTPARIAGPLTGTVGGWQGFSFDATLGFPGEGPPVTRRARAADSAVATNATPQQATHLPAIRIIPWIATDADGGEAPISMLQVMAAGYCAAFVRPASEPVTRMLMQDDTVLLFEPETGASLDALIQTVVQLPDYGAAWAHQDGGDYLVPSRWWQLRDAAHASAFLPQQLRVTSTTGIGVRLFTVRIVQVHTGTRDVRRIGRTSPIEMQRFTPPLQPWRYMPMPHTVLVLSTGCFEFEQH